MGEDSPVLIYGHLLSVPLLHKLPVFAHDTIYLVLRQINQTGLAGYK